MTERAKCSPQKCADPQYMCASCPNRDQFHVPSAPPRAGDAPDHEAARRSVLNKLTWAVKVTPADDPRDVVFHHAFTADELMEIQRALSSRAAEPEMSATDLAYVFARRLVTDGIDLSRPVKLTHEIVERAMLGVVKSLRAPASPPVAPGPSEVTVAMLFAAEAAAYSDLDGLDEASPERDSAHEWHRDRLITFMHTRTAFHLTSALARSHPSVSGTPERGEGVTAAAWIVVDADGDAVRDSAPFFEESEAARFATIRDRRSPHEGPHRVIGLYTRALSGSPARGEGVGS